VTHPRDSIATERESVAPGGSGQASSSSAIVDASGGPGGATPLQGVHYRPELPGDDGAIDAMHAETFGPGRFARTAFRLREGVTHDIGVSLVAEHDGALVGSVRLTPIRIGDAPALLLGPLTVRPHLKNRGIGKALMRLAVERARYAGHRLVLLVGDLPYYAPFGFGVAPPGAITMPGPVDPSRLLIAELVPGAADQARGRAVGG
jgi:predicted N-acetyltransferase YhbS